MSNIEPMGDLTDEEFDSFYDAMGFNDIHPYDAGYLAALKLGAAWVQDYSNGLPKAAVIRLQRPFLRAIAAANCKDCDRDGFLHDDQNRSVDHHPAADMIEEEA